MLPSVLKRYFWKKIWFVSVNSLSDEINIEVPSKTFVKERGTELVVGSIYQLWNEIAEIWYTSVFLLDKYIWRSNMYVYQISTLPEFLQINSHVWRYFLELYNTYFDEKYKGYFRVRDSPFTAQVGNSSWQNADMFAWSFFWRGNDMDIWTNIMYGIFCFFFTIIFLRS